MVGALYLATEETKAGERRLFLCLCHEETHRWKLSLLLSHAPVFSGLPLQIFQRQMHLRFVLLAERVKKEDPTAIGETFSVFC